MYNATSTIYSELLINRMKCGLPYTPLINTTLNEKFGIYPFEDDIGTDYPKLNLLTIGSGGSNNVNTRFDLKTSPHSPIDAALFEHIPFYLRKTEDILTYPPSSRLRLKKELLIDNVEYTAYYGYIITDYEYKDDILSFSNIESDYVNISKLDLTELDVLSPTPKANIDLLTADKKYISDFIKIYVLFSESEIDEIINAYSILKPNEVPIIREVGVCYSKDYTVDNNYTEQIKTQIMYFLDINTNLLEAKTLGKLDFYVEVGNMKMITL